MSSGRAKRLDGCRDEHKSYPDPWVNFQVLRYVPNFEPHLINISTLADETICGEVTPRLLVTVLKHIFHEGLGGQLDEILAMASEVLQQPSGLEMVMALLRYISRSAVKLDRARSRQQLLTHLPKEGDALMETRPRVD
ncbi:MAG: hypothetical protein R3E79_32180 [Caldilineaceae bacterium]